MKPKLDTAGYLRRLNVDDPGEPSVEALRALHAAHVELVAYEALEIQLGRPTTVDPRESAERIVARHRGCRSPTSAPLPAPASGPVSTPPTRPGSRPDYWRTAISSASGLGDGRVPIRSPALSRTAIVPRGSMT